MDSRGKDELNESWKEWVIEMKGIEALEVKLMKEREATGESWCGYGDEYTNRMQN